MRDGWRALRLGQCLSQVARPVLVSDLDVVPFAGVRWYALGVYPRDVVRASEVKTSRLNKLETGDVTYNRMWATKAAFGVVHDDSNHCLVTNDFPVFITTAEVIPEFIELVFQTDGFQRAASSLATGTTERRRLKENDFLTIQILVPSMQEQQRIVDLVTSVDTYIESLQQQVDAARTARNAVLHDLLSAGGDDWTETTLGHVVEINSENTKGFELDDEITYVDLSSVSQSIGIADDLFVGKYGDAPGRARRVVRTQDVLIATVRPYLRGFAVVPASLDGAVASTGFSVLRAITDQIRPSFVWVIVGRDEFVDYLMERATGSSYPAVRPDDVASFPLFLPPLPIQDQIGAVISSFDELLAASGNALICAKSLREGLLADLLSGEHEIPESYDRFLGAA
jgi:type I restriction enzyme S subunit